jgi:hypothetical protein
MQTMIRVSLDGLDQCTLVVPARTGIVYENQAGGTQCARPAQEGYLLPITHDAPLDQPELALESRISALFAPGDAGPIDARIAAKLEDILASSGYTRGISLDWSMLHASMEAWGHVTIDHIEALEHVPRPFPAILTWPNSD